MDLLSLQFTCVYLAEKVADRTQMFALLRHLLGHINGRPFSPEQCYEIEEACLNGLSWRLGPYFNESQLEAEDSYIS